MASSKQIQPQVFHLYGAHNFSFAPFDLIFGHDLVYSDSLPLKKLGGDPCIISLHPSPIPRPPALSGGWISAEKSWFFTSKPNLGTTHSLNCPKDAKNGFSRKFYIDIVIRKFSQLFFSVEKFFRWKMENIFLKTKFFGKDLVRIFFSLPKIFL